MMIIYALKTLVFIYEIDLRMDGMNVFIYFYHYFYLIIMSLGQHVYYSLFIYFVYFFMDLGSFPPKYPPFCVKKIF